MFCFLFVVPAVKVSKKVRINVRPRVSMTSLFPLAKLHGPISPELTKMWEMRRCAHQRQKDSQSSPPLYEKVLVDGCSHSQYMILHCL
jgi:condensin-2 complex subunit H2